jgi:hypothetical protein
MVHDLSQDVAPPASLASADGAVQPRQAVAGLMPPQLGEAIIRETWPSVRAWGGPIPAVAAGLMRTVWLAPITWPVAWFLLFLLFGWWFTLILIALTLFGALAVFAFILSPFGRRPRGAVLDAMLLPFLPRRYVLTNRRVMIRRSFKSKPSHEIALGDIDDVRLAPGSIDSFYHAADIEIVSKGQTALKLAGVPEPESFRHAILNAVKAWAPGKIKGPWQPASADNKS